MKITTGKITKEAKVLTGTVIRQGFSPFIVDETVARCNVKENAELIARILDADANNEVYEPVEEPTA